MTNGLLEIGEVLLSVSQRRLETVSGNVANATTPGFKASAPFETVLSLDSRVLPLNLRPHLSQGAMRGTGRPLDFAIDGPGFFRLSDAESVLYSRSGAFERDEQGRLVDARGRALQTLDGADVVVSSPNFEVLSDGIVLEGGVPVAQIGVFGADLAAIRSAGGVYFSIADADIRPSEAPNIRQGMLEGANVDLAAEMLAMMTAVRAAEAGARIIQTYDGLMGQTITTFKRS